MLATIASILLAIFLVLSPYITGETLKTPVIESTMLAVAIPLLFFLPIALFFCWLPLQKAENNTTPASSTCSKRTNTLHWQGYGA